MLFLKVFTESIRQAWAQLTGNKLRTFLSLVGISIGIFCIIGVLSAVDSLEENLSGSLAKLGDDVVYVDKWPWQDNSGNWWEFFQRPYPDHDDYEALKEKLAVASDAVYFTSPSTKSIRYRKNTVEGAALLVTTPELPRVIKVDMKEGRFWTPSEYNSGSDKVIVGYNLAEELFGALDPIGKVVKMAGRKYEVIGVFQKSGNNLINIMNFDDVAAVTYNNASRFVNLKNRSRSGGQIAVKAAPGISTERLEDEIRGVIRAERRLRPREEDNFALNQLSMMADALGSFFGVLNLMGWLIGGFSIIVGAISVANIMFVSVKERTSLIGVKKALGARRSVILLEFLTESVILCIIGGLMGLVLVWAGTAVFNQLVDTFSINLSIRNAILGLIMSALVGIVSGVIPASQAARMDPVDAMRS